jgi:polyisoprenoid-binding protein YceI
MRTYATRFVLAGVLGLAATAVAAEGIVPVATDAPAGTYTTDPIHTRVIFSVNHLGFSNYTAFFRTFEGKLTFDPEHPEAMALTAVIDPASVETLYKDDAVDFNAILAGKELLDAAAFPEMKFVSKSVTLKAPDTADVSGEFTMHGVTKPLTLSVKFNGGYAGMALDPGGARIGFSATGHLMRSDYGMGFGVPAPGTTMGVGDKVDIRIETELLNPDAPKVTE